MRKLFVYLILTSAVSLNALGQQNMTLYHMTTSPQQLYANPSFIPDAEWFMGIPGASSHHYNMAFTRLDLNDFLNAVEKPAPDSSVLNVSKLTNLFGENNYMGLQYNLDLIHFGFKVKNSYVTANISVHNNFQMNVPGDLFKFLFEGNGGKNLGKVFDFGLGLDFLEYTEIGIGYATRLMDDRLMIGARGKFIKGLAALETQRNDISFYTDPNDFTLKVRSDLRFNMANSYTDISDPSKNQDWKTPGSVNDLFRTNNTGWGLDLGAKMKVNSSIEVSGAINNLGWINWNKHTKNYFSANPGAYIEYDGVDYKEIFDTTGSFKEAFEQVGDSLKKQLALDSSYAGFQTDLRPEFYIGGTFEVIENHKAGILLYGSLYQHKLYPAFTLSWNSKLNNIVALSASYTLIHGTYTNIGLGFTLNGGPVQFYFVSDNLFGAFDVRSSSVVNFRTGLNLTFGRKKEVEPGNVF